MPPGNSIRLHEWNSVGVRTDCKPRANNALFRGEKRNIIERVRGNIPSYDFFFIPSSRSDNERNQTFRGIGRRRDHRRLPANIFADQQVGGCKMATKKRPTTKQVTPRKRTTPKQAARKKRSVRLTEEEIRVLASDLRRSFYHVFNRGYRMEFHNGENHLTMEPGRKLDPARTRRCMEYLGIDPEIIRTAVSLIERQEQTPPPKDDHVRMDTWFRTLAGLSPERIRGLVATTPEAKRKWEVKLRRNKMDWSDVHLSPTNIIRLTQRLTPHGHAEEGQIGDDPTAIQELEKGEISGSERRPLYKFFRSFASPAYYR